MPAIGPLRVTCARVSAHGGCVLGVGIVCVTHVYEPFYGRRSCAVIVVLAASAAASFAFCMVASLQLASGLLMFHFWAFHYEAHNLI